LTCSDFVVSFADYVDIDSILATSGMPSDEELIFRVVKSPLIDQDDEDLIEETSRAVITNGKAIEYLDELTTVLS